VRELLSPGPYSRRQVRAALGCALPHAAPRAACAPAFPRLNPAVSRGPIHSRSPPPQLEAELGLPLADLFAGEAAALRVLRAAEAGACGFRLRDRAEHVFAEAGRVLAFREAAEARWRAWFAAF
jgi:hypothetical protein